MSPHHNESPSQPPNVGPTNPTTLLILVAVSVYLPPGCRVHGMATMSQVVHRTSTRPGHGEAAPARTALPTQQPAAKGAEGHPARANQPSPSPGRSDSEMDVDSQAESAGHRSRTLSPAASSTTDTMARSDVGSSAPSPASASVPVQGGQICRSVAPYSPSGKRSQLTPG